MEHQDLLNTISVLSGTLDALNRAGEKESATLVAIKIAKLLGKIAE